MEYRKLAVAAAAGLGALLLLEENRNVYRRQMTLLKQNIPEGTYKQLWVESTKGLSKTPGRILARLLYEA